MRKVLVLAAVVALAGCGEKKAGTSAADSTAMMKHDSMMAHDTAGTMMHDSTMVRDTSKKM